ncbi:MAG: hypothetical protein U5R31_08315 [Acidimicrobiia bacterium]|nr:hypothetical protein [Acidimicrobiia bacterium]
MPQLFRQFGFDHAVVWRGVPRAIDRSAFWWSAPDGSTVRAEYLLEGYGNGAHLPDDAKELVERVRQFVDDRAERLVGDVLWMNGTDHLVPNPALGRVVTEANDLQDDYQLEVTSLSSYLASAPTEELPAWRGELRSGARANLLMGVASNRLDVRRAVATAERELEDLAEPLSALFREPDEWPGRPLELAWLALIRNWATTGLRLFGRRGLRRRASSLRRGAPDGEGLDRAVEALGRSMAEPGAVVVNPSARPRSGLVELRLPGEGIEEGLQLLSQRPTETTIDTTGANTSRSCKTRTAPPRDAWSTTARSRWCPVAQPRPSGHLAVTPVLAELRAAGGDERAAVAFTRPATTARARPGHRRPRLRVAPLGGRPPRRRAGDRRGARPRQRHRPRRGRPRHRHLRRG